MPRRRAPRLDLREVRVQLDLVDGGNDVRLRQQRLEVFGQEVADADRPHLAVGEQRLERLVGRDRVVSNAVGSGWCRISRSICSTPSLRGALLERVERLVVAVVADPDLRLDEDVAAVEAGAADRLADLALVAVGGGRVDVAVADRERRLDRAARLVGRRLEDAEADGGQLDAVVQLQRGDCRWLMSLLLRA